MNNLDAYDEKIVKQAKILQNKYGCGKLEDYAKVIQTCDYANLSDAAANALLGSGANLPIEYKKDVVAKLKAQMKASGDEQKLEEAQKEEQPFNKKYNDRYSDLSQKFIESDCRHIIFALNKYYGRIAKIAGSDERFSKEIFVQNIADVLKGKKEKIETPDFGRLPIFGRIEERKRREIIADSIKEMNKALEMTKKSGALGMQKMAGMWLDKDAQKRASELLDEYRQLGAEINTDRDNEAKDIEKKYPFVAVPRVYGKDEFSYGSTAAKIDMVYKMEKLVFEEEAALRQSAKENMSMSSKYHLLDASNEGPFEKGIIRRQNHNHIKDKFAEKENNLKKQKPLNAKMYKELYR